LSVQPTPASGEVVEPRPAATVIVVRPGRRDDSAGLEFLVLRRSEASRFAPGFVVFPGGIMEAEDDRLGERWFGETGHEARACALRELAEETGLVMTARGLVSAPGHLPGDQGLGPPNPSDVPEIARWIAPEFLPVRFDARFYALEADRSVEATPDGVEIERAWWARAGDMLAGMRAGSVKLMWPTLRTLEALVECRTVEDVLHLRVEAVPPPVDWPGRPTDQRPAAAP
jgi:ribonuclease/clavin/mitogillin